ncbi:cadherin-23-like [Mercenaria mercenaria]|uniref:cadherin-23-like n=1 Tax=Mercenaria mercenaria TaxID=6596 RepID=UPI00234E77B5|nr:cadherin-23-like [Mercenaria mercenaria]XP_045166909.2 cadherin-23-like [Mercenaria mercenaria]
MLIIANSSLACLLWIILIVFDHAWARHPEKPHKYTEFIGPNPLRIVVSERAAVNSTVTNTNNRITAQDGDLMDSQITFELILLTGDVLGAHYFGISRFDSNSVDIFIRNNLMEGYRNIDTYQLVIAAYDALKPLNKAYKAVLITIKRNEGGPKWTLFHDNLTIREDLQKYGSVTEVNAADTLDKDNITYSILDEKATTANVSSSSDYFSIDALTGIIKLKKSIFRTEIYSFELTLQACDSGTPQRCTERVMAINVSKDFPPQFSTDPFFVMHENEPVGYNIGKFVSTDTQPDGPTVYELINPPPFFEVNRSSGLLRLKEYLRNEFDLEYRFKVRAYDTEHPLYVTTANVTVFVIKNPNGPRFGQVIYSESVHETFKVGKTLIDVTATDTDGDTLVYSLAGDPNDISYLCIDPTTGVIKLTKSLINPPKTQIEFFVVARDQRCVNEKNATASVIVNVHVDAAPTFVSPTTVPPLKDSAKSGYIVHTVKANDTDLRGNMTYKLIGDPPAPYMFNVDPRTGAITLLRDIRGSRLDRFESYLLEIVAYDSLYPDKKATQSLTVNVTMSPRAPAHNKPSAQYRSVTNDSVLSGTLLGNVKTTGNDGNTYSLIGDPNSMAYFYTDPDTGALRHAKSLSNPPNTKLTVVMTVHTVKDNTPPQFVSDSFVFYMLETERAGYIIGNIDLTDNHTHGSTEYELTYPSQLFEVNGTSGQLTLKKSLRNDFDLVYTFGVRAYDAGRRKRIYFAKANVTVNVVRNTNGPVFFQPPYNKDVHETFSVCQELLKVDATDADGDTLVYSLAGDPGDLSYFDIDPNTGVIKLAKSLIDPPKTQFKFVVVARDQRCVNERNGTTNVLINVIVDTAPSFVSPTTVPPLNETAKLGDVVHILKADDADLGGNMRYKLVGRSPAPYMFSVHPTTGVITLSRDIRGSGLESFGNYTLEVEAFDSLFPNKKATQMLMVNITMHPGDPEYKHDAGYHVNKTALSNLHKHLLTIRKLLKPFVLDKHTPT